MRPYVLEGFDESLRPVSEHLWAENQVDAVSRMQRAGVTVTRVRINWHALFHSDISESKLLADDLANFCRELGTMTSAGIPLVRSLVVMSELMESKLLKRITLETARYVEEGHSLSKALEYNSRLFPPDMLRMIGAAEYSGTLDRTLAHLASQYEQDAVFRRKLISAMTYPAVVLFIGLVAQLAVILLILPKFAAIYEEINAELPGPTKLLMSISNWLVDYGWSIPFILVALFLLLRELWRRSPELKRLTAHWALSAPVFGPLNAKRQSARFVRTLAGLYTSGIAVVPALGYASATLTNPLLLDMVQEVTAQAATGGALAPAFRRQKRFPPIVAEMVAVGEETGSLDTMLLRAASQCETDTRTTLDRLASTLEPFLMVFLTVAVGSVLIPTMLPVLTLSSRINLN